MTLVAFCPVELPKCVISYFLRCQACFFSSISDPTIRKPLTYLLTYFLTYLHTYILTHSLTHLLTYLVPNYLLTHSLTHSLTPWSRILLEKLTSSQLVKKFSAFYGTPGVHYRLYKSPPPVPILSQIVPVHALTSYIVKIHLDIILPSTTGSSKWSLSVRFPRQHPVYTSVLSHTRYMPRPLS